MANPTRTAFEKTRQAWREHVLALPAMNTRAALLAWNIAHSFSFNRWKEDGQLFAYPSFTRLQQGMAASSRHTVSKAMRDLERMGAIRVVRNEGWKVRNEYFGLWQTVVHTGAPPAKGKRVKRGDGHVVHKEVHDVVH
jgi:hypothetical protein